MEKIIGSRLFRHPVLISIITIGILLSGSSVFAQAMWIDSNGICLKVVTSTNIGTVPNDFNALRTVVREKKSNLLSDYETAGLAVIFLKDDGSGHIIFDDDDNDGIPGIYGGKSNISSNYDVTENTIFQAGSISKPVSAWGLLTLVNILSAGNQEVFDQYMTKSVDPVDSSGLHKGEGFLNTYGSYPYSYTTPSPGDKSNPTLYTIPIYGTWLADYLNGVTLEKILLHKSGIRQFLIPDTIDGYKGWTGEDTVNTTWLVPTGQREKIKDTGYYLPALTEELRGSLYGATNNKNYSAQLFEQPSSDNKLAHYSGAGYAVMQKVMENLLRKYIYTDSTTVPEYKLFSTFMTDYVLYNLLMSHSTYLYGDITYQNQINVATGYQTDGTPYPDTFYSVKTAAGLYTTAPDLAYFVKKLIVDPDGWVDKIINPERKVVHFNGNYCILTKVINGVTKVGFVGRYGTDDQGNNILMDQTGAQISLLAQARVDYLKIFFSYQMYGLDNFWGHSGKNDGFESLILFHKAGVYGVNNNIPYNGFGLVVLTNSDNGAMVMQDIASAWWATYIKQYGHPLGW